MKLSAIEFRPHGRFTFSLEEVKLAMECSAKHYDSRCKMAGEQGGFIYGMNNRAEFNAADEHTLTVDQIDTLSKVMEVGEYLPDLAKRKASFEMRFFLQRSMHELALRRPETIHL